MTRWKRTAGICAGILLLGTAVWAVQKIGLRSFIVKQEVHETGPPEITSVVTNADGIVTREVRGLKTKTIVGFTTDDPTMTQERANAVWQEAEQLKAAGHYQLTTIREEPDGRPYFCYLFRLADGGILGSGDAHPWSEADRAVWQEIQHLIAQRHYTSLGIREVSSGERVHEYEFTLSDGRKIKYWKKDSLPAAPSGTPKGQATPASR